MKVGEGGPLPSVDEQRRALAVLWAIGTVGAVAFTAYDFSTPATDLPLVLVPLLYVGLVGATVALRFVERD